MSNSKHRYTVDLAWKGKRKGLLQSEVLTEGIEVATPPEFPGGMEGIWSPEHLFVASVSSCFMTTFLAIAELSKLEYESLHIKAEAVLDKPDGKYEVTEIRLKPVLVIPDASKAEKAHRILHKADENCLITRSIRSKVLLDPTVEIG